MTEQFNSYQPSAQQSTEYDSSAQQFQPPTNQRSGGFSPQKSPMDEKSPSEKKSRTNQSLMPCTIKQILNSTDGKIDDKQVYQVTIVGALVHMDVSTISSFVIDDGTGQIEAKLYGQEQSSAPPSVSEHRYVRVIGSVRDMEHKKSMVAYSVQPIREPNELSFHMLDVIYTHLLNTKGPVPQASSSASSSVSSSSSLSSLSSSVQYSGQQQQQQQQQQQPQQQQQSNYTPIQETLLKILHELPKEEKGWSADDLLPHLPSGSDRSMIGVELQKLSDEGQLYTTVDDQHFQLTSAQ
eukprot:TRINITY_DN16_c1_g1_i1.p1 TRINITY_DN16_c1_g1~~TRINITY_DN16_c1_g1_i1.p1  ORF type:complete len:295 (-),score=97.83 TRINITY_DN16_c1_g1_i1:166-1050(-)